ncbi:MAG: hypothetical protein FRX49_00731 [Trebouxia sp. A1-2]|nr:MAG: hypothetical protein FRX49_00731 [Trebouxia sp. A1-2]
MALDSPATEAPSLRAFASFASLLVVRCQRCRACWAAAMSSSKEALQPCAVCIASSTAAASSALLCFNRASRAVCSRALACDASSSLARRTDLEKRRLAGLAQQQGFQLGSSLSSIGLGLQLLQDALGPADADALLPGLLNALLQGLNAQRPLGPEGFMISDEVERTLLIPRGRGVGGDWSTDFVHDSLQLGYGLVSHGPPVHQLLPSLHISLHNQAVLNSDNQRRVG